MRKNIYWTILLYLLITMCKRIIIICCINMQYDDLHWPLWFHDYKNILISEETRRLLLVIHSFYITGWYRKHFNEKEHILNHITLPTYYDVQAYTNYMLHKYAIRWPTLTIVVPWLLKYPDFRRNTQTAPCNSFFLYNWVLPKAF